MIKKIPTFAIAIFLTINTQAQISYTLQSEVQVAKGENAPFWFTNNRQGLGSIETNNAYLKAGIRKAVDRKKKFDYSFAFDLIKTYHYPSSFITQQAYLDLKYKNFILTMGSKERSDNLKNNYLSSGGMAWSGNSRPIPQVYLGTYDFTSFPWLLNGRLKVKGGFSYGWYTDNRFQKESAGIINSYNQNILYHHKDLAFSYQPKETPWKIDLGLEQNTQFGSTYYLKNGDIPNEYIIYRQNVTFTDYLKTLIPLQGDQSSPMGDQLYMYGNTTGNYQIKLSYHKKGHLICAYLDNYFDDFSGMAKQNGFDALWGVEYTNTQKNGITGITLEYLQSTNQSGPIHWATHDFTQTSLNYEATGKDDYYNNYMFAEGWAHFGMNNGNPLLTSPIYNKDGNLWHFNNRVKAVHLGVSGSLNKYWDGRILATYSQNYGTHDYPYLNMKKCIYSLAEINYHPKKTKGWNFTISGGWDKSKITGDNHGVSLKISKTGFLNK